jgi:ferredoxin-NADP reductase
VLPYRGELDALREHDETLESTVVFTRSPGRNPGVSGRLNRDRLASLVYDAGLEPSIFVCGPTGFVETVAGALVELGHEPAAIRTERFGATGDERGLRAA